MVNEKLCRVSKSIIAYKIVNMKTLRIYELFDKAVKRLLFFRSFQDLVDFKGAEEKISVQAVKQVGKTTTII